MFPNPSTCCSPQSLRVYDRAPVNFRNQTVQACVQSMRDISYDQCVVCAHIDKCGPCLENATLCPVQGSPLMKRLLATITAPVTIEYETRNGVCSADGMVELPVDVLVRVPEVAPFDLRVLIDQAIVHAGEHCGNGRFALRVTVCAALFVVVESPCGSFCSHCPPQPVCPPLYPPCPPHAPKPDECCGFPHHRPQRPDDCCGFPPRPPRPETVRPVPIPQRPRMPYQDRRSERCRPQPTCECKRPPMPWLGNGDCGCDCGCGCDHGCGHKKPQRPRPRPEPCFPEYRVLPSMPLYPPLKSDDCGWQ